ncbi:hypothetical protein GCM10010269_72290 [Streptomyces humidus]|uniref:Uncharacterized protein n=1 Tax=Streptomyces humidus TaxID=52259 RepID=A0A918LA04_9ACTN|nr:hypothetical protein [Streptomyces humidus]GGS22993.1 hypothetical protein GCM10010269_72290 [Streptomyces humidus]
MTAWTDRRTTDDPGSVGFVVGFGEGPVDAPGDELPCGMGEDEVADDGDGDGDTDGEELLLWPVGFDDVLAEGVAKEIRPPPSVSSSARVRP